MFGLIPDIDVKDVVEIGDGQYEIVWVSSIGGACWIVNRLDSLEAPNILELGRNLKTSRRKDLSEDGFEQIGVIPRNEKDVLKVRKGTYWNIEVIDIRWFTNDKISRKGVRVNRRSTASIKPSRRELDE